MNKTELIDKIAAGAGLTKVDAKKALDATVDARLLSSRLALSSLTLSTNNSCKEKIKRATPLVQSFFRFIYPVDSIILST